MRIKRTFLLFLLRVQPARATQLIRGIHSDQFRICSDQHSVLDRNERREGSAVDLAFTLLGSPDEAVATKVYSMSTIERLCHREPGLIPELRLSLEHQLPRETKPAFRSRARQVLASLDRLEAESRA